MNSQVSTYTQEKSNEVSYQLLSSHLDNRLGTIGGNNAPWGVSKRTRTGETLTIRAAVSADAAMLATVGGKGFAAIHQAAVPNDDIQHVLASAWSEMHMAEMIANPEIQTLVAEIDEQIVGLTTLNPTYRPSYLRSPTPIELGRFYLHLDWVGYGIGSKLMAQALRQAAATGYGVCWLRVWQGNKTAIEFYRRWGFTTIAADSYAVGNTVVPVWVMIRG